MTFMGSVLTICISLLTIWRMTRELRANAGTTIKDRVTNLEKMQEDQMVHLKDITTDLARQRDALERIEKLL